MDKIKKRILPVRHGTTELNETDRRSWAGVDFWNRTSQPEAAP